MKKNFKSCLGVLLSLGLVVSATACQPAAKPATSAAPSKAPLASAPAASAPAASAPAASAAASKAPASATPSASAAAPAAGAVTIKFYGGWTGPDVDTMRAIVQQYMTDHKNVNIQFESQQWTPLFTKLLADISAGTAPDILAIRPMDMGQFIEQGIMDDKMASSITYDKAKFSEAANAGTMYKGKQYAIPLDQHMHGVYYNKDAFQKAGITSAPKTGDEFVAAAQKLTIDKNGKNVTDSAFDKDNVTQYGVGFNVNHHVGFQMSALINQQGEVPFTQDMKKVPFSDDKAIKALQWVQDLVYKHKVTPVGEKSPIDDFKAGKIAMLIDGPWQRPALADVKINWDTTPYPAVFGKQSAWGNEHMFSFPITKSNADQKQAVRDFMTWMISNSGKWANSGQIPASNDGLAIAKTMPGAAAFIESMPAMYLLPASGRSAQLFGSDATSPFVVAAQDLLLNNKPAKDVVANMRKSMDDILAKP